MDVRLFECASVLSGLLYTFDFSFVVRSLCFYLFPQSFWSDFVGCHIVIFKNFKIYIHSHALRMLVWQTRHIAPEERRTNDGNERGKKGQQFETKTLQRVENDGKIMISRWWFRVYLGFLFFRSSFCLISDFDFSFFVITILQCRVL